MFQNQKFAIKIDIKIPTQQLLNDLKIITEQNVQFVESLLNETEEKLNFRPSEKSWSILECIEHLNLYGKFYIPEIDKRIQNSDTKAKENFSSGFLGNYFANSMLPKEKLNTMKTFKSMNPIHNKLDRSVLNEFIAQQKQMIHLLKEAKNIDLNFCNHVNVFFANIKMLIVIIRFFIEAIYFYSIIRNV